MWPAWQQERYDENIVSMTFIKTKKKKSNPTHDTHIKILSSKNIWNVVILDLENENIP